MPKHLTFEEVNFNSQLQHKILDSQVVKLEKEKNACSSKWKKKKKNLFIFCISVAICLLKIGLITFPLE